MGLIRVANRISEEFHRSLNSCESCSFRLYRVLHGLYRVKRAFNKA